MISGTTFFGLLGLLFIGLKLTEEIDWSWWWVLSPFWLPTVLYLAGFLVYLMVIFVRDEIRSWR